MMKTIRSIAALRAALLGAVLLTACDKNAVQIEDITSPVTASRVKFFNFGINAPSVNFYANDAKVTAISSTTGVESTNGVAYGSVGLGGFYSELPGGQYSFTGRIAATVDKDLVVATVPGTLENGKAYSVYLSGFYNTTAKSVEGFIIEDAYPAAFDYAKAYVRFVNASPNSQPMALVISNTVTLTDSPIGAAVPYKSGTAFVAVDGGVYNLSGRIGTSTTTTVPRTNVSFLAGRVYTITLRGDMTISATGTATNRPFLDNTLNR